MLYLFSFSFFALILVLFQELFSKVAEPGKDTIGGGFTLTKSGKQLPSISHKDEEFYIPHVPPDHRTEMG